MSNRKQKNRPNPSEQSQSIDIRSFMKTVPSESCELNIGENGQLNDQQSVINYHNIPQQSNYPQMPQQSAINYNTLPQQSSYIDQESQVSQLSMLEHDNDITVDSFMKFFQVGGIINPKYNKINKSGQLYGNINSIPKLPTDQLVEMSLLFK